MGPTAPATRMHDAHFARFDLLIGSRLQRKLNILCATCAQGKVEDWRGRTLDRLSMGQNHEPHARYACNFSTARPACMQLGDFHCMIRRYCYRAASIQRRRKSHVAGTETKRLMMPLDYRDFADLQSQTMRRVGQVRMFHQLAPHLIVRANMAAHCGK